MSIPNIELLEDEEGVEIHWPAPKYQRVCAQGHLVTDLFNSYEVPRGKDGFSYACKRCQLEANRRQKEKKQGTVAGEPYEETPDTPERREEIAAEHAPGPDEKPGEDWPKGFGDRADLILHRLDVIERKMDDFIADRHPHIATRILTDRIAQLEEQLAEAKKGPSLDEMTFDQLKAKAAELGVEIPKGLRSAGARKLIQEHLAGQAGAPEETLEESVGNSRDVDEREADVVDAEIVEDEADDLDANDLVEPDQMTEAEMDEEDRITGVSPRDDVVDTDTAEEPPRRRRRRKTDEELEEEGRAAEERAKAKTAARKAAAEADEEPAPRRRRRPRPRGEERPMESDEG